MPERQVKFFNHPAYSATDWSTRNPKLNKGEIGFVLDALGQPYAFKVGDGTNFWNDLPLFSSDKWEDTADVLSPIGDAEGNLYGKNSIEILDLMLNPYQTPAISSQGNDGGLGLGAVQTQIIEIGRTVSGPVNVSFSVSNQGNLDGSTPINVTAGGTFTNEGDKPVGLVSLTLGSPITPTGLQTITIALKANHLNGVSPTVYTYMKFQPKMLWGVSQNATITPSEWTSLTAFQSLIMDSYEQDIDFNAVGYAWFAIPAMLAPGSLIFTDVTDPNAPAGYGVTDMGQQTINNGVGNYAYQTYRSTFYLNVPSILRIRNA